MGMLFLDDGAGIAAANWVVRAIVADVVPVLVRDGATELATWLSDEASPVELFGDLDVRELTPGNQGAFRGALPVALLERKARGPGSFHDPRAWPGYIALFENLVEQVALLAAGRKPEHLPNLLRVPPYDGTRSGPGWPSDVSC